MMTEVRLPELGEGIETALILDVLVEPGDTIHDDDAIIEVESEKATTEIPSPLSGVVREVRVTKGDEVHIGDVLLTIQTDGVDEAALEHQQVTALEPAETSQAEVRPEPASPPPEEPGAVLESPERDRAKPRRERDVRRAPRETRPEPQVATAERGHARGISDRVQLARPAASPTVRRFARELGIDLAEVAGTGAAGRIDEEDVKSHVRSIMERRAARPDRADDLDAFEFHRYGAIEREPMSGVRRATAKAMEKAWRAIPMVSQFDRADLTSLAEFKNKHAREVEQHGGRLTITVFVLKVLGEALRRFPAFNASVDVGRQELVRKSYIHVGVAMDTSDGLLVPVFRDVNEKSLTELAIELVDSRRRVDARQVSREELRGASSTLTNLGSLGTTYFTPIVTYPQTSVLGVGRALPELTERGGHIETRELLPLVVTYDHRATDGADAARFLRFIASSLESPFELLLH